MRCDIYTYLERQPKKYDYYAIDHDGTLHYPEDPTGFRFRLYIGENENGEPEYYRFDHYFVKDGDGNYCRYDIETGSFVSLGVQVFEQLTQEQKASATFTTSPSGAIDKIPADHDVEIRNLLIGTPFMVVERASDIPKGYNWISYERDAGSYLPGEALNQGIIRDNSDPHIIVNNHRGWGLTAQKVWSDSGFMTSHDDIFIAVYNTTKQNNPDYGPIPGTVRLLRAPETSLYYYFEQLEANTQFSDYSVREVVLVNPVVDENGYVTSYDSLTPVEPNGTLASGGISQQTGEHEEYHYRTTYEVGVPGGVAENIRTDTVHNTRPGIRLVKTDWTGQPLPNAVFTLTVQNDSDETQTVGAPRYVSAQDCLITTAYLQEGKTYTLTETVAPDGYEALIESITLTLQNGVLSIGGVPAEPAGVVTQNSNDPSGMLTVKIKNRTASLQMQKLDAQTNEPLANAHFALYRQVISAQGPRKDYFPMEGLNALVTDSNGLLTGLPTSLNAGTYYLSETAAPTGYLRLADDIVFTVDARGHISLDTSRPNPGMLEAVSDPLTGHTTYNLRAENERLDQVMIVKVDQDTLVPLAGAQFALYREADYDLLHDAPYPEAVPLKTGTTGSDGLFPTGNLPQGVYYLQETKAPIGYYNLSMALRIEISNGVITIEQNGVIRQSTAGDNDEHLLTVYNKSAFEIPATGVVGSQGIYMCGALLSLSVPLVWALSKRRQEKKKHSNSLPAD